MTDLEAKQLEQLLQATPDINELFAKYRESEEYRLREEVNACLKAFAIYA